MYSKTEVSSSMKWNNIIYIFTQSKYKELIALIIFITRNSVHPPFVHEIWKSEM